MTSYAGRHAEHYDLFYADKPYADEAALVDSCLRKYGDRPGQRLLELACGTGRHAVEFARLGYDVAALDWSPEMLRCAVQRAENSNARIEFQRADMRTFDLLPRQFDAAVCLFDSLGYVQTNEAVLQVLRNVVRHLRPGGLFVFEFWHAAAMLRGYDPVRVRRWQRPKGELVRISETTLHCARQTCDVRYTIHELRVDGSHQTLQETQTNRFFLVQEMALLLSCAGLTPRKWLAGFGLDENITEDTWHVVVAAQKPSNAGGEG
jgi:SAM-dependent methyltransferase